MKLKTFRKIAAIVCIVAMLCMVFTGCTPSATTDGSTSGSSSSNLYTIFMLAVICLVFYFMFMRPESKRKKKLEEMRSQISAGDNIVTIGGIAGKVVHVSDEFITFETGEDRVRIQAAKWAISTNNSKKDPEEDKKTK